MLGNLWRTSITWNFLHNRSDTIINKIDEVARKKDLRDEDRANIKNLSVQGLLIRFECCFSLSNDSNMMNICRKTQLN